MSQKLSNSINKVLVFEGVEVLENSEKLLEVLVTRVVGVCFI